MREFDPLNYTEFLLPVAQKKIIKEEKKQDDPNDDHFHSRLPDYVVLDLDVTLHTVLRLLATYSGTQSQSSTSLSPQLNLKFRRKKQQPSTAKPESTKIEAKGDMNSADDLEDFSPVEGRRAP